MAGYSGTPLAKKLGIKEGSIIKLINEPVHYFQLFTDFPEVVHINRGKKELKNLVHFFTTTEKELRKMLPRIKSEIVQDGCIWVSWPKKSARTGTDITEDVVRNFAIEIGLVDIKVCAIDEIWSGLKLVIPVKDRT